MTAYAIHTASKQSQHPTTKVTNKQGYQQSGETTKAEKQPKVTREHPKQQRRRTGEMLQATEEKAARQTTEKAADERIRLGETTSPQGG